ncbi:hypothetical protein [Methanolapillus africanus]
MLSNEIDDLKEQLQDYYIPQSKELESLINFQTIFSNSLRWTLNPLSFNEFIDHNAGEKSMEIVNRINDLREKYYYLDDDKTTKKYHTSLEKINNNLKEIDRLNKEMFESFKIIESQTEKREQEIFRLDELVRSNNLTADYKKISEELMHLLNQSKESITELDKNTKMYEMKINNQIDEMQKELKELLLINQNKIWSINLQIKNKKKELKILYSK